MYKFCGKNYGEHLHVKYLILFFESLFHKNTSTDVLNGFHSEICIDFFVFFFQKRANFSTNSILRPRTVHPRRARKPIQFRVRISRFRQKTVEKVHEHEISRSIKSHPVNYRQFAMQRNRGNSTKTLADGRFPSTTPRYP